jgi:hypothetical protein
MASKQKRAKGKIKNERVEDVNLCLVRARVFTNFSLAVIDRSNNGHAGCHIGRERA